MLKELWSWIGNILQLFTFMIICYFIGWALGFVLAFTPFSEWINSGLNLIFDTERFTREHFANLVGTTLFFGALFCRDKSFMTSVQ